MKSFRYPGVTPFKTNQSKIFFGRNIDVDKLYTKILISNTVALHAVSGTGKSSLINAGLIPEFERNNDYISLIIDLEAINRKKKKDETHIPLSENILTHEIITSLKNLIEKTSQNIPYLLKQENSLWYWFKLYQWNSQVQKQEFIQEADHVSNHALEETEPEKGIVLIFDQFENIESFGYSTIKEFAQNLCQLFSPYLPSNYYEHFVKVSSNYFNDNNFQVNENIQRNLYNQQAAFLKQPLNVKVLFVVREDKFGVLSNLSDYFPDILKNDYRLLPLTKKNAKEAIEKPAFAEGEYFSPQLEFNEGEGDDNTLNYLVDSLADSDTSRVDPIEIQIICQYVEKKVIGDLEKKKIIINPATNKVHIPKNYLPPISDIVTNFYNEAWSFVKHNLKLNDEQLIKSRRQILEELVVNEKRIPVFQDSFSSDSKLVLEKLNETGLIRKNLIDSQNFYQLVHDRFIKPLFEDYTILKAKEDTRNKNKKKVNYLLAFAGLLVIIIIFSIYLLYNQSKNKKLLEQESILTTAQMVRHTNPTLSFEIANSFIASNQIFNEKNKFLKNFDSSKYSYLSNSFSQQSSIIDAYSFKDKTTIIDKTGIYNWNKDEILQDNFIEKDGTIIKRSVVNNRNYFIVDVGDSLKIKSETGEVIKTFLNEEDADRNFTISSDGAYVLIGYKLFNYITGKKIGELPAYSRTKDQMTSVFLNDNKHIAVGYWSGDIIIFCLNIDKEKLLKPVKWLTPPIINSVVTSIAINKDDTRLIAGNRTSTAEIWSIDSLDNNITMDSLTSKAIKVKPLKILKGHSNNINCVAYSNNSKYVLTGSDDNSAILWDAISGSKLSILEGRDSKVEYVNFAQDSTTMMTGTADGRLFIWKREKASDLYNKKQLALFCPFDYYNVGLNQYNIHKVYDTSNTYNLFSSTLHYLSNLPAKNNYPEDIDYANNLKKSITEVKSMYLSLVNNKNFFQTITLPNKRLLYNYYNFLLLKEPELLGETKNETTSQKYARYAQHHINDTKRLLLDTIDVQTELLYSDDFLDMASFSRDSSKDYNEAIRYLKFANDSLITPFFKKYPLNSQIRENAITVKGDLASSYLYAKKIDSAKIVADSLSRVKGGEGIANLCYIRAYLMSGQYDNAVKLFLQVEEQPVRNTVDESYKKWLLRLLQKTKDKSLGNTDIDKFIKFLDTRKTPALSTNKF